MTTTKMTWQERQAKEKAERALVMATLTELAAILGGTLDAQEGKTTWLHCADYSIHIYHNEWKSRLHISGSFPHDIERHRIQSGSQADPDCSITVGANRQAAQIAKEIERRIVPTYHTLHAIFTERATKYNKSETEKEKQAVRIAAAGQGQRLGERDPWRRHEYYPTRYVVFGGKRFSSQPSGEAEITGIDKPSISMKLYNLPPELAEHIASLLGEWGDDS